MAAGGRARAVLAVLTACAIAVLAGCGGSGYEYVSNREAGLHFRVPDDWAVLEVSDSQAGVPEAVGTNDDWLRLLDRSPTPGVANFDADLPRYPVGLASVVAITSNDARDELDYAALRALAVDGVEDPLDLATAEDPIVQLVSLEDVTTDDGARGERIVFTTERPDGSLLTTDQTALVDPLTTEVYRLLLKCEAHCYESNRDEIDDIVESWTVELED